MHTLNLNQSRQNAYCSDCTVQIKAGEILTNAGLVWVWEQVFEVYKVWEMLTITKNEFIQILENIQHLYLTNLIITKLKQNLTNSSIRCRFSFHERQITNWTEQFFVTFFSLWELLESWNMSYGFIAHRTAGTSHD